MKNRRQTIGRWGEAAAADFLREQHYTIVAQNVRTPYGEIDLIAQLEDEAGTTIVFVEVKTRTNASYGLPEEAVNARKQSHLLAAAQHYIQEHHDLAPMYRIDVISVERVSRAKPPVITHFENALNLE